MRLICILLEAVLITIYTWALSWCRHNGPPHSRWSTHSFVQGNVGKHVYRRTASLARVASAIAHLTHWPRALMFLHSFLLVEHCLLFVFVEQSAVCPWRFLPLLCPIEFAATTWFPSRAWAISASIAAQGNHLLCAPGRRVLFFVNLSNGFLIFHVPSESLESRALAPGLAAPWFN